MKLIKKSLIASLLLVGLMGNTFSLRFNGSRVGSNQKRQRSKAQIARDRINAQREKDDAIESKQAIAKDPHYYSRQLHIEQQNDLGYVMKSCGESMCRGLVEITKWVLNLCKKSRYEDDESSLHIPNETQNSLLGNQEKNSFDLIKNVNNQKDDSRNFSLFYDFADEENSNLLANFSNEENISCKENKNIS